jgi:outer membrane murein-binding lipoprotein Lpp
MTCYVRGMTKMQWRSVALAAVLAAGCGSKASDTPAASDTSTCAGAVDAAGVSLMDARKKTIADRLGSATDPQKESRLIERAQKVIDQVKAPLLARCTEDKWPAEVLTCLTTVRKQEELRGCIGKLPTDQAERATAEIMKTMQANIRLHPGVAPNMMSGNAHGIPLQGGLPVTPPPTPATPGAADPTAGAPAPAPTPPAQPAPATK